MMMSTAKITVTHQDGRVQTRVLRDHDRSLMWLIMDLGILNWP